MFQYHATHIYKDNSTKEKIDSVVSGPSRHVWEKSLSNELGRLAQGNANEVRHTDIVDFLHKYEVPRDIIVAYDTFVLNHRPLKIEKYRVRITVGGNSLTCEENARSSAANILETKVLINSVILDVRNGEKVMTADIKDYFFATLMDRPEYMKVLYKYLPTDIKQKYNLDTKITSNN